MRRALAAAAVLVLVAGGCGRFARSSSISASTTAPTFGALPPLESLTGQTASTPPTTAKAVGSTVATRRGVTTTVVTAAPAAPADGGTSAVDAMPCANPKDRHASTRTDAGGLFVLIGVAKNCVGKADRIELVLQVGNPGKSTLYVSSAQRPLISLLGAGGTAAWSDPCEVKAPPPGGPPDVPIAIEPGKSAELARVFYDPATSECGVLGSGRYEGQASVAQCTADDAADQVCDTPKRIPSNRLGVEIR